jgi:hypothetical protein
MNEEYLWDKSGEPDPEIQKLEEILGTLRYQPKPLPLPDILQPSRRHLPWLAIAAAVLLTLLAGFVWLRFQSKGLEKNQEAKAPAQAVPAPAPSPEPVVPRNNENVATNDRPAPRHRKEFVAVNHRPRTPQPVPSKEALLAKEQLMSALRLASEKLNLAQRKAQGPTTNQIRNQHKLG